VAGPLAGAFRSLPPLVPFLNPLPVSALAVALVLATSNRHLCRDRGGWGRMRGPLRVSFRPLHLSEPFCSPSLCPPSGRLIFP
jgi:hypothetical protein